jgi:hypothetical protein
VHRKTEETHEDGNQQETSPTPGKPLRNLAFRWTFPNSNHNGAYLVSICREVPTKNLGMSNSEEPGRCVPALGGVSA